MKRIALIYYETLWSPVVEGEPRTVTEVHQLQVDWNDNWPPSISFAKELILGHTHETDPELIFVTGILNGWVH